MGNFPYFQRKYPEIFGFFLEIKWNILIIIKEIVKKERWKFVARKGS